MIFVTVPRAGAAAFIMPLLLPWASILYTRGVTGISSYINNLLAP